MLKNEARSSAQDKRSPLQVFDCQFYVLYFYSSDKLTAGFWTYTEADKNLNFTTHWRRTMYIISSKKESFVWSLWKKSNQFSFFKHPRVTNLFRPTIFFLTFSFLTLRDAFIPFLASHVLWPLGRAQVGADLEFLYL